MSSIISFSNTSNYVSNVGQTSTSTQPPAACDGDGDGDSSGSSTGGPVRGHHHGGGHHMGGAAKDLVDALKSLGLSLPQNGSGSSSDSNSSSSDGSDSSGNASSSSDGGSVRGDMRAFMHSLFQAVRSENSSSDGSSPPSGDPKAAFASGLSALTTQVSNGSAPSDLQASFDKLMSDLQPASGSGTPTLQQLLGTLQQEVGYGSSGSSTAAVGNTVSTTA